MKDVKVLGPGCKRCQTVEDMVKSAANALGISIALEKVTDYAEIARFGIVSTPGIVIDGKVVHAGGIPKEQDLLDWLQA
ncbi:MULTISPECIES: thioredoxin family protein [unclassified Novosphingobium]|uniref:thioredoxin family protein n=1 Tax=unclassified Novosphingobium TaxID=2644732 RepID=UPI0008697583|nr:MULTISPECIES: thioredoxin family protein [unclassified Novosphingobium]MBN9146182.1 TM0996/MTH895 family glutaredoxin-like protein [Novosphingobium sp.]ODU78510.1 MAG: glutaredoxin [Novosphingobium sp. SCN 63-17]OJX93311.1 MAG: thioredoxin family protein [Novosphingobium sp. 63-713]